MHHTATAPSGYCLCCCDCRIDTGARRTHQDLRGNIVGGWNTCAGVACMPAAGCCLSGILVLHLLALHAVYEPPECCCPSTQARATLPSPSPLAAAQPQPLASSHVRAIIHRPHLASLCRAVTCKSYDPPVGCTRPAVGSPAYLDFSDASGGAHGTHTAGSAGAVGNNSVGITGVAQQVGRRAAAQGTGLEVRSVSALRDLQAVRLMPAACSLQACSTLCRSPALL